MTSIAKLAVTAATALGIAISPVPAAADGEDVAKVLAGIAILGILAKAADDRKDRRAAETVKVHDAWPERTRFGSIDQPYDGRTVRGELRRPDEARRGKVTGYKKKNPLPDRCLLVLDADRGRDRLVYGQRCLERSYKFARKLPEHCQTLVRTDRGRRVVYGARCLARDGWRVARR